MCFTYVRFALVCLQVKLLRDAFKAALGEEAARLVDVNTIDGFQGREKDVCFFSCVRSVLHGGVQVGHGCNGLPGRPRPSCDSQT